MTNHFNADEALSHVSDWSKVPVSDLQFVDYAQKVGRKSDGRLVAVWYPAASRYVSYAPDRPSASGRE